MPGETRCPVCGRRAGPADTAVSCAECGWPLNSPLQAGAVTAGMREDFEARLRLARQAQGERDMKALAGALAGVVTTVRPERGSEVVEVSPDRIEIVATYLDAMGSPQVRDEWSMDWTSLLPGLPDRQRDRHAELIDGSAGLGGDQVATLVRDRLPPARGERALVVCHPGGQLLDAAAEAVAGATRPPGRLLRVGGEGEVSVRSMLAEAAAKAPLRRPYYLLTAAIHPGTGEVRPRLRQLFAVGATPDTEETLPLLRMPGDVTATTLAIFADNGRTDWSDVKPLVMYQVPAPAGPEPRLRVVLDGPGRVRIAEPAGAKVHQETWSEVWRRIPARVSTTASPVDVVCAVDLSGPTEAVRQRKGLARDLIQLLGHEYPDQRQLRVAVVTCTDHVFGRRKGKEYEPVTNGSDLGPAADALEWLRAAEGADVRDPLCAPVEDLLYESLALLSGSRRHGRRPRLLTLAGRPPHPYPQRPDGTMACPLKFSWERIVDELDAVGARYVVVPDKLPAARDPARAGWNRLGSAGQHALPAATARQVAEDLGLLAGHDQRIPLPLAVD